MAKTTVAQIPPSFHDLDAKLREMDYLLIKAFNINRQLIITVDNSHQLPAKNGSTTGNL